jgi:predicted nucleic acid-binding protein
MVAEVGPWERAVVSLRRSTQAVRHQLSACDAAHLWLAAELKARLTTFDQRLATAARTQLAGLD